MEFLLPGNCPASLRPTAAHLWKTFRSKLNAIPVDEQNCSPSHRNHVHLPTGMLSGITTEWRSASDRNRVHLRPDSPGNGRFSIKRQFGFHEEMKRVRITVGMIAFVALFAEVAACE